MTMRILSCTPRVRLPLVGLLLALLLPAGARAQQVIHGASCAGDKYGSSLGCSANDVAITQIAINRNYYPGVNTTPQANLLTGAGCVGGTNVVANLNVTVQFNAPARYDIGVYLAEDGGNPQYMKSAGGSQACTVSVLPLNAAGGGAIPNPFGTGTVPSPFNNSNPTTGAYCGDGSSTTVPTAAYSAATGLATGTGQATFVIYDVPIPCSSGTGTGSGKLNIPFVVTWTQNAGNFCAGAGDAISGTKSKCNAPSGTLGDVDVVALPSITKSNGTNSVSIGDAATYTITVANNTGSTLAASTFKDPAVTGLATSGVTCAAAAGANCPAGLTVATLQSGLTLDPMPNASTLTFTVTGKYTSSGLGTTASPWVPAPGSQIVNTATVTVSGVANSAIDSDTLYYPSLANKKTVSVVSDPVRGLVANALSIPGAVAQYSITVTNSDTVGKVDTDTVQIDDAVPANTYLYYQLATGITNCAAVGVPVSLAQGATSSTLTLGAADLQYSSDGGTTWTATPAWTFVPAVAATGGTVPPGCYASNITNIRANPKGRMAAASAFTLNFNVWLR